MTFFLSNINLTLFQARNIFSKPVICSASVISCRSDALPIYSKLSETSLDAWEWIKMNQQMKIIKPYSRSWLILHWVCMPIRWAVDDICRTLCEDNPAKQINLFFCVYLDLILTWYAWRRCWMRFSLLAARFGLTSLVSSFLNFKRSCWIFALSSTGTSGIYVASIYLPSIQNFSGRKPSQLVMSWSEVISRCFASWRINDLNSSWSKASDSIPQSEMRTRIDSPRIFIFLNYWIFNYWTLNAGTEDTPEWTTDQRPC